MKMKHIIFFGAAVVFSSCSTAYRSGQTPDDVYYSPAPVQGSYASSTNDNGYVSPEDDNDRNSYYYRNNEGELNSSSGMNQSYLSLAPVTLDLGFGYSPYGYGGLGYNPYYYNSFGNPFYSYDPYGFYDPYMYNSFGYSGLGFYNPYSFYNPYGYYNPYMYNSFIGHYYPYSYYPGSGSSSISLYSGPRRYNLNAYTNNRSTNTSSTDVGVRGSNSGYTAPAPIRRTTGVGNIIRRVFSPNSNNTYVSPSNSNRSSGNSNYYRRNNNSENYRTFNNEQTPSRNFNSSPSVSTPSNSGSGSAPVRTFRR